MKLTKFEYMLRIANTNKSFIRNIAANSTVVNEDLTAGKSWREIPGPSSLPIIGPMHHFMPGGSFFNVSVTDLFQSLNDTYGPIARLDGMAGRPPLVLFFDAESSAQVLRSENWLPIRPGFMSLEYYKNTYVRKTEDQPTSLISDHGDVWRKFRSKVNPVLLQPKTVKLYSDQLNEVADDMIARMKSIRGEDNVLRSKAGFDVEMNLWSLESVGVVALGERLNCLDPNLPEDSPARKLIQVVHDFFSVVEKLDLKPSLWRYYATPTFKKAMKVYSDQESITQFFVRKKMEKLKTEQPKSEDEKGMLEKLLEIDEQLAFIMASDMLFAGVDTTANAVMFVLYQLASNPEKQEKLREEVMRKDEKSYLKACIKETLRMMPVVSGNTRQTTKEYNLLGYKIPKDMFVIFNHQIMSLSDTHYVRPKEFIPERWLVPKEDPLYYGNAHPFAYVPFGFGARNCIGRRIAELEVETFITKIMENFQVGWFGPPLKVHQTSLNYATAPFNYTFKDI